MSLRRRIGLVTSALAALGLSWLWINPADAAPAIESVSTAADYTSVTVLFAEDVSGSGAGGALVAADVSVGPGAGATLSSVTHTPASKTVVLGFDAAVQPGTGLTITIVDATAPLAFPTEVPLAAGDWTAVEASLRAIDLPVADLPIAPYLAAPEDDPRTLGELLPATMATSLELPEPFTVARKTDGSFTVSVDGSSSLVPMPVAPSVVLGASGGVPYGLDLTSTSTINVDISLGGTIELDKAGVTTGATLALQLETPTPSPTPTLSGGIGIAEATVASTLDLDVSIGFDLVEATAHTPTVTTASAVLGDVTIAGLGAPGTDGAPTDISVPGGSLLTITWPSLSTTAAETGVAVDSGWAAGNLLKLANVTINDLLGAPGGVASWLSAAQTLGTLATPMPIVPDTLGDGVGAAQSLAAMHDRVAVATAIAFGPLADTPRPHLSPDLCADLAPSAVRAAKVARAIANLDPEGDDAEPPTTAEILAELPDVTVQDGTITTAFSLACGYLFDDVVVDLVAGTIESEVDIPEGTFDFFGGQDPVVDLSYEVADLGPLAVALDGGTWTGTSNPKVDFTLGLKLDSASSLLDHKLAVDLGEVDPDATPAPPVVAPDAGDVTAAYRVYVPDAEPLATSTLSVTGTGLTGFAQLGFLDLAVTGEVAVTPAVSLAADDPETGFADGKADLLELLAAAAPAVDGTTEIDDVLTVTTGTDDVDASFVLTNATIGTNADLDVMGDVAALTDVDVTSATDLDGADPDVSHQATAIAGPTAVDPGKLVIGHTLGDAIDVAQLTPTEVVTVVADALDGIAASETVAVGDERIPLIDVSLNEVTGLSTSLAEAATALRERAPTSVTELEAFTDDALTSNGLGGATVGLTASGVVAGPELTLTLDAAVSAEGSYPVSFELSDGSSGVFNVAPTDGGSRLDAEVQVDLEPVLALRLDGSAPVAEAAVVRDLSPRFDLSLSGDAEGSVTIGPADASITGTVSIGDADLGAGGFTAATTAGGASTIPLADLIEGGTATDVTTAGTITANEELTVSVPTETTSIEGTVDIVGLVPGTVTYTSDNLDAIRLTGYFATLKPNLRTLANGAIETARFIARGSEEVAALAGQVPVVGADVAAQFDAASVILDDVAAEIQAVIDLLDEGDDAAAVLEDEINALFEEIGCSAPAGGCAGRRPRPRPVVQRRRALRRRGRDRAG